MLLIKIYGTMWQYADVSQIHTFTIKYNDILIQQLQHVYLIVGWQSVNFWGEVATKVEQNMLYTKMFIYVCSMWNWRANLQTCGASLAIQDGVQDGRRFLPIKAKTFSQAQNFIYYD